MHDIVVRQCVSGKELVWKMKVIVCHRGLLHVLKHSNDCRRVENTTLNT